MSDKAKRYRSFGEEFVFATDAERLEREVEELRAKVQFYEECASAPMMKTVMERAESAELEVERLRANAVCDHKQIASMYDVQDIFQKRAESAERQVEELKRTQRMCSRQPGSTQFCSEAVELTERAEAAERLLDRFVAEMYDGEDLDDLYERLSQVDLEVRAHLARIWSGR